MGRTTFGAMLVEVVRSKRRRKTVELRPTGTGVRISIPASATAAEEERYVKQLLRRYERRQQSEGINLPERAETLAKRYSLPRPRSIRFVDNQNSRWGSCTPSTGEIRISRNVAKFPLWVLDYVIVHEMAHLLVIEHNSSFWALVQRYDKAERARGFLIAKSMEGVNPKDAEGDPLEDTDDVDDVELKA